MMTVHSHKSSQFWWQWTALSHHTFLYFHRQTFYTPTNVSGSKMCSETNWNMFFLSPWRRILLGIPTVTQLLKKFPVFRTMSRSEWRRMAHAVVQLLAGLRVRFPTIIGIFHSHNPSGRTMVLGSTQLLTEMSNRNISFGVKTACA